MKRELSSNGRSRILVFVLFLSMTVFVVRLFFLQVIEHDYYVKTANLEQVKRLTIPAKRGLIYAMNGDEPVPLVMNQTVYTVFADPQIIGDKDKIIEVINRVAGGNARSGLADLLAKKESRYQILATRISRLQADKIKEEGLSGIGFQEETIRVYPEAGLAAQTLGFVDYSGIARYGVESKLDERLTGKDGLLQSVTDVRDVPLTIGDRNINKPAQNGENIVLSIDRNIQSKVEQALADGLKRTGATHDSAIVMNPQNGHILAMANLPSYNPEKFYEVEDAALFNNAVTSVPYEPGSDVKTFTMAVGIDKGVVTPDSTYNNTDYIQVEDRIISNATKGQTGVISFQHALNWSLNTGFVTIAQLLGDGKSITRDARDTMYDYFYNRFGLGQLTGVEVSNEARGIVISPEKTEGNAVRYSNMSFGQGLDVTMVQVASAFCSLVNGGNYYAPTVIAGTLSDDGQYMPAASSASSRTVSESTANQVRQMTHEARSAFYSRNDKPGYYIGGKTGTSQVIRDGVYTDDETVATYLGFGGGDTTDYVIMVQVSGEHQILQGARDAMPIFTDISNWMIDYLKIQPKE